MKSLVKFGKYRMKLFLSDFIAITHIISPKILCRWGFNCIHQGIGYVRTLMFQRIHDMIGS